MAPLGVPVDAPLVLVPTARTWNLPWTALHAGVVALAPSAASWLRTARAPAPDGRVVLVAGPDLPGAAAEVTALARLHPGSEVLTPPTSTVGAVLAALGRARLAHLACHGRLRADNPTFSSFLLSAGELTLHELDGQRTAPHRVVLSACDSGTGTAYDGDELIGFVGALFARGSAGLLASCVQVADAAVVPLVCAVHEELVAGATTAEALHAARAAVDTSSPAAFAAGLAFTAYGAA
ncbi:CHAT domain-containing protein [Kineococcus indalonis]|uniref:CHAT domain-containing protein n=1 Tax=Kineococcus indalonis TaxID=2696566 RepID=UPI0038992511